MYGYQLALLFQENETAGAAFERGVCDFPPEWSELTAINCEGNYVLNRNHILVAAVTDASWAESGRGLNGDRNAWLNHCVSRNDPSVAAAFLLRNIDEGTRFWTELKSNDEAGYRQLVDLLNCVQKNFKFVVFNANEFDSDGIGIFRLDESGVKFTRGLLGAKEILPLPRGQDWWISRVGSKGEKS